MANSGPDRHNIYGFYAICAALSAIFVFLFILDTRGRELEDMVYD